MPSHWKPAKRISPTISIQSTKAPSLGKSGLDLIAVESLATAYFGMNVTKAPFDQQKVRQAVAYAINSKDIVNAVVLGSGSPANSPIGPQVFGYNPDAKMYDQNIEKAKALMTEAGIT